MPWPKGKPFPPEMVAKRIESFKAAGAKRKRPSAIDGVEHWRCPVCRVAKPADAFYRTARTPSGLSSECRACHGRVSVATRDRDKAREHGRYAEARRRARKAGASGCVTAAGWRGILAILGPACLACGADENIQQDHIVPLARGGAHDLANLQPLCRRCNERKQARTADYRTAEQRTAVEAWVVEFRRVEPRAARGGR